MNEPTGILGLLFLIFAAFLVTAAILMPIFVFIIAGYCESIKKTLAKMEDMMRNGK